MLFSGEGGIRKKPNPNIEDGCISRGAPKTLAGFKQGENLGHPVVSAGSSVCNNRKRERNVSFKKMTGNRKKEE